MERDVQQQRSELKELIYLLDQHNFECCNSEKLSRMITEIKVFVEDLLNEKTPKQPIT